MPASPRAPLSHSIFTQTDNHPSPYFFLQPLPTFSATNQDVSDYPISVLFLAFPHSCFHFGPHRLRGQSTAEIRLPACISLHQAASWLPKCYSRLADNSDPSFLLHWVTFTVPPEQASARLLGLCAWHPPFYQFGLLPSPDLT